MRALKRLTLVLVGLLVVLLAFTGVVRYFGVVRHQSRVTAFEDDFFENVFVDFGGGAPVTTDHGRWGRSGIGVDRESCSSFGRATFFQVDDPIGLRELAVQAERMATYLEGEGWLVRRVSDVDADQDELPGATRVHEIRAVRGTELATMIFLQDQVILLGHTNNCGKIRQVGQYIDPGRGKVVVESFTP